MDSEEIISETVKNIQDNAPFLGTLDIALLAVLIAGSVWYYMRSRQKDEIPVRTYSIQ